jgi:hypothetical protein
MQTIMRTLTAPNIARRAAIIAVIAVSCVAFAAREYQDHQEHQMNQVNQAHCTRSIPAWRCRPTSVTFELTSATRAY